MSSNQSNIPRESGIWKKLWKVKSVPRHLHLIWRILHNRLPVKFSLFNRGINCTPLCCFCDQHTETIDHLFMKCDWSKSLWFASPLGINFSADPGMVGDRSSNDSRFSEWLQSVIMKADKEIIQIVCSLCYEIWNVRNKRCFEGINMPMALDICKKAIKEVTLYNNAAELFYQANTSPIHIPRSHVRWRQPSSDSYKLNVDAAGPNDVGSWGLSAVVRDSDGVVLAAACWYRPTLPDSDTDESMAMLMGLNFAKDLLFLKLEAESDSANVIEALKDSNIHQSYLGAIVAECQNIRHNFNNISFSHVRREANQVAHYLAKYAIYISSDVVWIEETPSCIDAVVAFDLMPHSDE